MANLAEHALIRDRYETVAVLGHGAQGEVFKALDHQHDRLVALKVRPVPPDNDRQALLAEARILLSLRPHPNLPVVRDDFFWDGSYVLVMDWIEGNDLGRLLTQTGDPGLPLPTVVDWLGQAAAALHHLHNQQVVHGDIKPSNLVLTSDGRVVLVDFGISRGRDQGSRQAMGSPGYSAPELVTGDAGPAADVYGLAATGVALLTGSPPSAGRPDWAGVPSASAVERALRRGLATDAARRPHSPLELVERLRANLAMDLPTGVVTFLATDVEGSAARWDDEPETMARLATEHDGILTDTVERSGGRVLRTRGEAEATLSVFTRATDAVGAALAAQRILSRDLGLAVRIAIHSGEAEVSQLDYVGRTVNRATRLRSVALGGQVLLSLASADLASDTLPPEAHLANLGYRELPGMARGERVFELRHPDLPDPGPGAGELDGSDLGRGWPGAMAGGPPSARVAAPSMRADRGTGGHIGNGHEPDGNGHAGNRHGGTGCDQDEPAVPAAVAAHPSEALTLVPGGGTAAGPVPFFQAPSAGPRRAPFGLPAALSSVVSTDFVGRQEELDVLAEAWSSAQAGERRLILLTGEPGIGKTELAARVASAAQAAGAAVLYGRCDEGLQVPYQPFAAALGQVLDHAEAAGESPVLGRLAGELVRLAPDVVSLLPDLAPALRADPETEQFRLFDAVGLWLRALAEQAPVVLVLDDLHWATRATLLLLAQVMREDADSRLLVIGTYRDSEVGRGHPLVQLLTDLRRVPGAVRLGLGGLAEADVLALLERGAGHDLGDDGAGLARFIQGQTDGNPFFVREVLRHLVETGGLVRAGDGHWQVIDQDGPLSVPDGVRDVVGRRLSRLAETTAATLELAAVIGMEFELAVLVAGGPPDADATLAALDESVAARLIVDAGEGRFRFGHALVRSALLERLTRTGRSRTHQRVAEAIERVHAGHIETHLAELAVHYAEAAVAGEGTKAVAYATRAGDVAGTRLAFDEAVVCYRLARDLLATTALPVDEQERCRLLIRLGEAEFRAGMASARESLLEAAAIAERWRDPELLAAAALAGMLNAGIPTFPDHERVPVLEAALAQTDGAVTAVRARLSAHLALALVSTDAVERRRQLSEEAVDIARRLEDPAVLAEVLVLRSLTIVHPDQIEQRQDAAREQQALAGDLDDPVLAGHVAINGVGAALEAGDVRGAWVRLNQAKRLAEEVGQPVLRWQALLQESRLAAIEDRLDDAEELAVAGFEHGRLVSHTQATLALEAQLFMIRYLQGRLAELAPRMRRMVDDPDLPAVVRASALSCLTAAGEHDACRGAFEALVSPERVEMPRSSHWLSGLVLLAGVCTELGDVERAAVLARELAPYRECLVLERVTFGGHVSVALGRLYALLDRWDEAESSFARAQEVLGSINCSSAAAASQLALAEALADRGLPEDECRITTLIGRVLEVTDALGLPAMGDRAWHLRQMLGVAPRRAGRGGAEVPSTGPVDAGLPREPLVGRDGELQRLRRVWDRALAGRPGVVLVSGEPGVGKSRLVGEVMDVARAGGATVFRVRCQPGDSPYQPFVQLLQLASAAVGDEELPRLLGRLAPELIRLVPELADRLPAGSAPTRADVATERYRLFDAVAGWLRAMTAQRSLMLVLDDLHAAASPTLQLLRHVTSVLGDQMLMVVGLYSDTLVGRDHPLSDLLADLRRRPGSERIHLAGLDLEATGELLSWAAGLALDDDGLALAEELHRETEGNAFLLREVLLHLSRSGLTGGGPGGWQQFPCGQGLAVPDTVRQVVSQRLDPLSLGAGLVLATVAVAGRELALDLLEEVVDLDADDLAAALEELAAARVLREEVASQPRYRFVHGLVRDTLYDQLAPCERASIHLSLGLAMEKRVADEHLVDLGRHFALAGTHPVQAAHYVARAGDALLASLAAEEAAVAYRQALGLLDEVPGSDTAPQRAQVMVALGKALRRSADPAHRETLMQAAEAARELGDKELLVQAALALNDEYVTVAGLLDEQRLALMREAVEAAGEHDSVPRALLLAFLSVEQTLVTTLAERDEMSGEAVAIARRVGDLHTLAVCLGQRVAAVAHVSTIDVRRRLVVELAELASRLGDIAMLVQTDLLRYQLELSEGNIAEADRLASRAGLAVSTLGGPAFRRTVAGIHGLHAFVAGRFDDADRLFTESFEMGLETGHPVAFVVYAAQLGSLRLFQGRYRELDGLLAGARALAPGLDAFRGALGVSLAEAGHLSEARAVLDEIAADNFAGLRHSSVWLDGMALCARLCSRLGDADRGRQVARELRPYLGKFVADGPVCLGPVEHYLGLALHAAGETAEAIELLRGAVTLTNELATPGFCTWARLDLARMLLATGQAGNVTQAQELLTTVIADGASLGMVATVREANELAERLVRAALPTSLAAHGPAADLPSRAPARSALDASWARARAGHRELVLITGANGAGRSSLASRTAAAAYESGAAVFAGRCDDRSRVSLAPFREMFADAAAGGTLDVDDVHADVARLVGGPGINDGMPFGSTVDVMLDDALENHRAVFLDNVVSCLQHMAGLRPLVLVVEGLDRSDRATLLTLERLLRRASSPGLLVMGTATNLDKVSGVLGADIATLAAGEEVTVTEVAVPSVTVEDAEAMLRFRRPHDSAGRIAELAGALVPGCGGCASALGMLVDEQVVTGGLASGPADVVAARLTRLGAFGLEAFVAGAVAGQRFSVTVVEHMLGRADGTLSAQFRQAEQLGLLVAEPSAPGRFRFVSTQVRARAVASLSAAERARLHRQACRAIEAVVPPAELTAHADELAHHYRLGGSPVGGERAASWLVTAGEVACRVHSYELAERLWEEALDLLDHSAPDRHARRAQLLALLGRLRLVLGGDPVGALALSREALALYERAGETRRAAIVRAHLGLVQGSSTHRAVADVDSALHHFAAADVTLGSADESVADAFHLNWAYAALRGLRLEDAGTHARHAEQGAIRRRDPVLAGRSQVLEALVDWERGELDDAAARIESVAGQTVVYPVLARLACWARSYTLVISGDPLAGLAWADRALTIPGLEDTPMARRWLQEARYRCLWDLGRLQDLPADWYGSWPGATAVRGAVDGESLLFLMDRLGASGDRLTQVAFAAPTASFLRRRNPARARVLLHDALSFATAAEARTLEYLVRVELAIVDPADGRTHLDAARRLVGDGRSWVPLVSGLDHAEAVVRAHGGDGAGAEAAYARAMEAQRALGRPWDELATLLDRAASRGQAGDGEGSAADRIRAIVLVRSLGGDASWVG